MTMAFMLHPRLAADTAVIADWPLSRVLVMNDKRFPWLVLVPRRLDVSEFFDLDDASRSILTNEITRVAKGTKAWAQTHGICDKINIGMIGNIVPQLHVHVVARHKEDAAWPGTVWGVGNAILYGAAELSRMVTELREIL
jgi:diadenosine tetraphosphate (Ap4A) HIT family hydrolase